jgi:long-chain acyl-CoA synthetase
MSIEQAHAAMTAPGSPYETTQITIAGRTQTIWKNAPPTMREIFLASRVHGEKIFLVYEDERVSFDQFARATLTLAHALQADGVTKGDRVVIAMRNLPEWPVGLFAAWLVGAIAVPLNAWWTGPELEYALRDCGATVAIIDAERLERIAPVLPQCPALKRVYVSRSRQALDGPQLVSLESVIGTTDTWGGLADRPVPAVVLEPEDDASILYTSGTTGNPKGALGTHRNAVTTVATTAFSTHRNFVRAGQPIPKPEDRTVQVSFLVGIPFFHVTGCLCIVCPALLGGGKLVAMHRWETERAMALIERERCSIVYVSADVGPPADDGAAAAAAAAVAAGDSPLASRPAHERYDFSATPQGGTHLAVHLQAWDEGFLAFLNDTWPKALQRLKALSESTH